MGGCLSRKLEDFDPEKDLGDLRGKVILVTGGNTGIGYHTVKILARKGATVYLGARDQLRAKISISEMQAEGLGPGNGEVIFHQVNFSNPRWAKDSAEEFMKREGGLDILINNAAELFPPFEITEDGISKLMIVNPFIFTRTLLPLLIKTAEESESDVRIVTLSSIAHQRTRATAPDIHFNTKDDFNVEYEEDIWPALSRVSKLCSVLFSGELQKRLDAIGTRITCIAIHPGEVNTFANRTPYPLLAHIVMGLFFMRPEAGAYTPCFAAASPKIQRNPEKWKGKYLVPLGQRQEPSENAQRGDLAKELWEATERILGEFAV